MRRHFDIYSRLLFSCMYIGSAESRLDSHLSLLIQKCPHTRPIHYPCQSIAESRASEVLGTSSWSLKLLASVFGQVTNFQPLLCSQLQPDQRLFIAFSEGTRGISSAGSFSGRAFYSAFSFTVSLSQTHSSLSSLYITDTATQAHCSLQRIRSLYRPMLA